MFFNYKSCIIFVITIQITLFNILKINDMRNAIKKEIRKQINKVIGSHLGTVHAAIKTQFPSADLNEFTEFINSEFKKKYA